MSVSVVRACQIVVRSMSLNKFYSEFALVTRIKIPFFPRPNLIFYKPYVTSRNGPLMHNTAAYTSHIQNRNTCVIVEYHNELIENSISSYTFVWATEKKVQELLSKSVPMCFELFMGYQSSLKFSVSRLINHESAEMSTGNPLMQHSINTAFWLDDYRWGMQQPMANSLLLLAQEPEITGYQWRDEMAQWGEEIIETMHNQQFHLEFLWHIITIYLR